MVVWGIWWAKVKELLDPIQSHDVHHAALELEVNFGGRVRDEKLL